jgi:ribosome maturation factor RimP
MTAVAAPVAEAIGRTVEGLGYEFVDAERLAGGLLRVTIDRVGGIGLADCERVSRQLSHALAVDAVDYARLEVSSPGLDRPLKGARDFRRFAGERAQVQLHAASGATGGRRKLQGRVLEVSGEDAGARVRLQLDAEVPAARPGVRAMAAAKPGSKASKKAARGAEAPGEIVEFALADVEKAKLVPELDFRGAGKESLG